MEFRVLGPVELWSAGARQDLGSVKERCVLAVLLLDPCAQVAAEALIDRVWGADPPAKVREDLFAYVSRIRKRLRHTVGDQAQLRTQLGGYVLDIDSETVDLHLFRLRCRQARAMARSGEAEQAILLLTKADALWHGIAVAGLPGDWLARIREGLEEERRAATAERTGLELSMGRHEGILGDLRSLLARYPLDERFIAQAMTALYRCGRQADALDLYRETHRRLQDEQGAEPGPGLSELHQQILRHDADLAVTPVYRRSGGARQPGTLPPISAQFVGRAEEIAMLTVGLEGVGSPSIQVIEGMPGIGKTALAAKVAHTLASRYPDAQLYVNFRAHEAGQAPLGSAEAVRLLLEMLDVPASRIPAGLGERAALWRAELTHRRAVVILDDVPGAAQIRPILPPAGDCLVLITSRQRLRGLDSARTLTLRVLPDRDARALFTRIAGPEKTHEDSVVAEAIRLCGHLPLAIRLAAGRLSRDRDLSLAELVDGLSASPGPDVHENSTGEQVTSAFELSYRGLTLSQQRLFRLLGLNPCTDITPAAATALGGTSPADTQYALAALLDHHLLEQIQADRYRLHDLVRAYARSRALRDDPQPEQRRAVRRLLDYYLHTADRADRMLFPGRHRIPVHVADPAAAAPMTAPAQAQQWLEAERHSLIQAVIHAGKHEWQQRCAGLAHVIAGFLEINGYLADAIAAHELALRSCRDLGDARGMVRAALDLCDVYEQTGRYQAAIGHAEDAASTCRALGDQRSEGEALNRLGTIQDHLANFPAALAYYYEARDRYLQAGDQNGVAHTLCHAGIACWSLGRYAEADKYLAEALELYRLAGNRRGEAAVLSNMGEMKRRRGYHRDAVEKYEESARIFAEIGGKQNYALLRHNLGIVYQYKGDYERALSSYVSALTTYRETGDMRNQAIALNDIGISYQSMDQDGEALACHLKAKAIADEIGDRSEQVIALTGIADARQGHGSHDDASRYYDSALRLAREIGDPYQQAKILDSSASTVLQKKGPQAARICWRQALDIFQHLGLLEAESVAIRLSGLDAEAS